MEIRTPSFRTGQHKHRPTRSFGLLIYPRAQAFRSSFGIAPVRRLTVTREPSRFVGTLAKAWMSPNSWPQPSDDASCLGTNKGYTDEGKALFASAFSSADAARSSSASVASASAASLASVSKDSVASRSSASLASISNASVAAKASASKSALSAASVKSAAAVAAASR